MHTNSTISFLIICVTVLFFACVSAAFAQKGEIVFFAEHEGGMHKVDIATGQVTEIDVGIYNIGDIDFNQKINKLVFEGSGGHFSPQSLYLLDLQTYKTHLIIDPKTTEKLYRPKFHPNGQYLYAVNYSEGIFRYALSSSKWTKMEVSATDSLNPQGISISKSGKTALISPGDFKGFLLANVENKRFRVIKLILSEFDSCISPRWAGDKDIYFAGRKEAGLQFIWSYNLETEKLIQLTQPPIGTRDFLSLSPSEKEIVFTGTGEHLEWRLWHVNINGTDIRRLTKGGSLSGHLSHLSIDGPMPPQYISL